MSVAAKYLSDITGKAELPSFSNLIDEVGLTGLLPSPIAEYQEEIEKDENRGLHKYKCNLDKAEIEGERNKCITSRTLARDDARLAAYTTAVKNIGEGLRKTKLFEGGFLLPPSRANKGFARVQTHRSLKNQVNYGTIGTRENFSISTVKLDRAAAVRNNRRNNIDAIDGVAGKSIGMRAVLYNADGTVDRGTNAIRDKDLALELSSKIPSETIPSGKVPDKIKAASTAKSTSAHPNKGNIAPTLDPSGGISALVAAGGIAGVMAVVAALLPLHFVTSAITFLTSVTTMITNVNNWVNTFLKITDGLLGIFGFKGGTKPLRKFVSDAIDNTFGKTKVQEAKNLFASCVNAISTTTKLLEKVTQKINGSDGKIDEVATRLAIVNNYAIDNGMIPSDSPYQAQSKSITEFVASRTKDNEGLKDNITSITEEIKTRKEVDAEIKTEKEAIDKKTKKVEKDINDTLRLVDKTKTNVDKIKSDDL